MGRDGFELEVSKPQVIFKEIDGKKMEPMELVSVEVPNEFAGVVIVMMGKRSGTMKEMKIDGGTTLMDFAIPTRGLIGSRGEFLTNTKGLGIMNSIFLGYEGYKGEIRPESRGSIVATETGTSNSFGLLIAQGRGKLFIGPGVPVYEGMVVGQNAKSVDMPVNICKAKELTNFRSKNEGTVSTLDVPLSLSLEDSLAYISDNEMVEITPKSIRIRKIYLSDNERKKARKEEKALVKDSD